ncbi:MAG: ATP-binding protein [Lachnospiraceae bacterium]|nr:ATP-binding protein [Lachnospiraceae bacterium]MDD3614999.1 ATP-binding protein [Lachnospiraceae bacterium]
MYVNLEDLSFYGSNRFGNMSEAPDYKSGYHQLLNQASDKDSQIKIKEFLSPKILRAQDEFDGKMTTARISLRAPGQKEIKTWEVFKMFSFIENKKMMTLLFDDVTEDAAILKKALKDAEDANHAKTEFLSRMSHDIRTPMNAIIGMTNLAKDEDCSPKVKEYLNNIDYSSKFLLGLINDILDLSKIESGELVLKPVPYTLAEFETSINTVIRPLFEAKNITFVFQMNARINCIMTDKLRFNQIFFNLLSNAAKFTPRGGKVEFVAEEISPKAGVYGARYYVRDNGIGMSEEFLPHVFEQFSQENSEKSNGVVGTGLGLPIVKSLVDAMGGTIEINSRLGAGTEYVIELYTPLVEPDTEEVNLENEEVSLENRKILLAEDNDMNILVARRLLEKEGCQITIAKNGKAAVEAFTTSPIGFYDAILMDVRMPEMTGIEATETIRGLNRRDSITIPIIAMTADAFAQEQKKTLDAGMNYHLSKPIEPQKLYKVLKHYISRKDKL